MIDLDIRTFGAIFTACVATAIFGISHTTHLAEFFVVFVLLLLTLCPEKP